MKKITWSCYRFQSSDPRCPVEEICKAQDCFVCPQECCGKDDDEEGAPWTLDDLRAALGMDKVAK